MVKSPRAGRVKTRLAHGIGAIQALAFYRRTATAVVDRLAADRRWETWLAVAPDAELGTRALPGGPRRVAQGRGDLGERMQRLLDARPPGPVVIVGSDIPGIRPRHLAAAFRSLGGAAAVFGPVPDGGYWLVGGRRRPRRHRLFDNVRWSCVDTLADSLANLDGVPVARAATLYDVDTAKEHASCRDWCGRRVLPAFVVDLPGKLTLK